MPSSRSPSHGGPCSPSSGASDSMAISSGGIYHQEVVLVSMNGCNVVLPRDPCGSIRRVYFVVPTQDHTWFPIALPLCGLRNLVSVSPCLFVALLRADFRVVSLCRYIRVHKLSVSNLPGQCGVLYAECAYAVRHSRYVLKR